MTEALAAPVLRDFTWTDITRFLREWDEAFNASQVEPIAGLYSETALLVAANGRQVSGRSAIREFWRNASQEARRRGFQRTLHLDQYDSCGDIGYLQGTVSLSLRGDLTVVWFVTVWQRQAERNWQIVADTFTVVCRGRVALPFEID